MYFTYHEKLAMLWVAFVILACLGFYIAVGTGSIHITSIYPVPTPTLPPVICSDGGSMPPGVSYCPYG
jgi:hypothetical protein